MMNYLTNQEKEAIDYIENKVEPLATSEIKTEGLWQEVIFNFLKQQTLTFVGKSLGHLKERGIEWAVDLADWLLEKLHDYLLEQYQKANSKEKEIFKRKMREKFPNSNLTKQL